MSKTTTTNNPTKPDDQARRILAAAGILMPLLVSGRRIDSAILRQAMTSAFGATDAEGGWCWKRAYEATECAQVIFLQKHLAGMRRAAKTDAELISMLRKLASLLPTHTRRSEEQLQLQQFSTPLELAWLAAKAAAIQPSDLVLEPSAGTGLLAAFARSNGAALHLNELGEARRALLSDLFTDASVTSADASQIHDHLPLSVVPTVVLMNPPFSAAQHVKGRLKHEDYRHLRSALLRLAPGGRLVAITSGDLSPKLFPHWFEELHQHGTMVFTCPLPGTFFKRHGTTVHTRLTVFDKQPGVVDPGACHGEPGSFDDLASMLEGLPHRLPVVAPVRPVPAAQSLQSVKPNASQTSERTNEQTPTNADSIALAYVPREAPTVVALSDGLYEPYVPESISITGAKPHPTKLVQSAAMASVRPPLPTYRPHMPAHVVTEGILSDAQLESVVYAGEAHSALLAGAWRVNETMDVLTAANPDDEVAVRFRRGWFLGDGTGAGKGRQVAGIILDNWLKGRRRAIWISKSDKLLEDAQRDWSALGQERLLVVPLDRFKQGTPIKLKEGILFTTYATLRSAERNGKSSRLQQIIDWAGPLFDGPVIFDEAHAMANAAGGSSERGDRAPSQQGLAGLRLQHALHDARVVYVSATGATTVENLAYAQRLGLWGSDDMPFDSRADFVASMQQGGIASSEVLARDLKALGLYMSRSLSYEGVEVDILEHELTAEQIRIYDAYARAYQLIHNNLDAALKATNVTSDEHGTMNKNARSAARSAFESNKLRFFNHLITSMKMPTLLKSIREDLDAGHAAIVQLVSTSESLMERRLSHVPAAAWGDLDFDITPREYVLDYLMHSFPTALYEIYSDEKGNKLSRPVMKDGQVVESREAVQRRDAMLQSLAALPPVQSALDQLIHHFGTDHVAEVTGRSRRIVREAAGGGFKLAVQNRPPSSNLAETQAFMDDKKRILVFSDAGGTGRSYHADLSALNRRKRVHYLLEAGWKADNAIQGLGRSNRTNQVHPPLFRPVATDIRGEKRFLSTIARRLDSLGAITRGQRQTGGQGLFRPADNLESAYARAALQQLYRHIHRGLLSCCSLDEFEHVTGLSITDADLTLKEVLPPISTFLNRILALEINLQNQIFHHFEQLIVSHVESAKAAGRYEIGLETIRAEELTLLRRSVLERHLASGATTELMEFERKDRILPLTLTEALNRAKGPAARLLLNERSGRAALALPAPSITLEDGGIEERTRLVRPTERTTVPTSTMEDTYWRDTDEPSFRAAWQREIDDLPLFATSRFHIISGLLIPVWKKLPYDNPRVYRFQTTSGDRIIGRLVPPEHLHALAGEHEVLDSNDAWARLEGKAAVPLSDGMMLKPVVSMHLRRIELVGFHDTQVERLKAIGCIPEIVAWKLRLFVPMSEAGKSAVTALIERYGVRRQAA